MPARSQGVSYRVPFIDLQAAYHEQRNEIDSVMERVARQGRYILGPEVEAFETEFAAFIGSEHCIGVANGTDALMLALLALGLSAGDEVLVPSHTCSPTWTAIVHAGGVPVPIEIRPDTWTMDPDLLASRVTDRTRAIVPVHIYGQPVDMDAVRDVAKRHGLMVVEDAAQAQGSQWHGRKAGALGDAAAWSFNPVKNLGAFGDAGAVTTNDPAVADRLRALRIYGWKEHYSSSVLGYNSRLDELQAALLRVKLQVLDEWNQRRRLVAEQYLTGISSPGSRAVVAPVVVGGALHSWHLFVVRCRERTALRRHLRAAGIETLVHYPVPMHLQPAFAPFGGGPGSLPITEDLADQVLSLPMGPHISSEQVESVIEAVESFAQSG